MSAISRDEVEHLARLARIALSPEELTRMAGELDAIVDAVASVSEVAGDDVPATSHPQPLVNVLRPDVPEAPLARDAALAAAPARENGYFRVPRMLEEN